MKWKIEGSLEEEPFEEEGPNLYRSNWLQRPGCRCSGLVPKYS